jgi:hypothetical protein
MSDSAKNKNDSFPHHPKNKKHNQQYLPMKGKKKFRVLKDLSSDLNIEQTVAYTELLASPAMKPSVVKRNTNIATNSSVNMSVPITKRCRGMDLSRCLPMGMALHTPSKNTGDLDGTKEQLPGYLTSTWNDPQHLHSVMLATSNKTQGCLTWIPYIYAMIYPSSSLIHNIIKA